MFKWYISAISPMSVVISIWSNAIRGVWSGIIMKHVVEVSLIETVSSSISDPSKPGLRMSRTNRTQQILFFGQFPPVLL